jgi:hypothetical protein
MLKSEERERLQWREKMRDVNFGERERVSETWNESQRLGEKKERVWKKRRE